MGRVAAERRPSGARAAPEHRLTTSCARAAHERRFGATPEQRALRNHSGSAASASGRPTPRRVERAQGIPDPPPATRRPEADTSDAAHEIAPHRAQPPAAHPGAEAARCAGAAQRHRSKAHAGRESRTPRANDIARADVHIGTSACVHEHAHLPLKASHTCLTFAHRLFSRTLLASSIVPARIGLRYLRILLASVAPAPEHGCRHCIASLRRGPLHQTETASQRRCSPKSSFSAHVSSCRRAGVSIQRATGCLSLLAQAHRLALPALPTNLTAP